MHHSHIARFAGTQS